MIFYFTATGNSLYAARYLESDPISIPQVMGSDRLIYEANKIGIVCPVYGHEVPPMVKDFLKNGDFKTDYFYMVLTYGNRHGGAAELAEKLCEECGIHPAYINVLMMVDNWLPSFDMEEQVKIDKKVEEHLAAIREDIEDRRRRISEVTETDRAAHRQFLANQAKLPPCGSVAASDPDRRRLHRVRDLRESLSVRFPQAGERKSGTYPGKLPELSRLCA